MNERLILTKEMLAQPCLLCLHAISLVLRALTQAWAWRGVEPISRRHLGAVPQAKRRCFESSTASKKAVF